MPRVTPNTPTGNPVVGLNPDKFDRLCKRYGLLNNSDRARALGVGRHHLSQLANGHDRPGSTFIARVLITFGVKFESVFEVEQ